MKESKLATILALAALDDSAIKSLEQRVNELAELGFKPEIVEELPEEGNDHTLYLVPQNEPGEDPWYKEYLWLDDEWENIGTTSINFENFEQVANKVTSLSNQSTDTQYPSAKAVYDSIALSKLELQTLTVGGNERLTVDLTTLKPGIYLPDKKTYSCSIGNTILDGLVYAVIIVKEYQETVTTDTIFAYVLYTNNGIPTTTVDHDLRLEAYYKRTGEIGFVHKSIVDNCGFVTKWAQTFDGVKTFSSLPISTSMPTTNYQLTNKKYVDDTVLNNAIQYNTMPTASADNINKIIQYTGTTTQDYTHGYFYQCVNNGGTYSWENINIQQDLHKEVVMVQAISSEGSRSSFDISSNDVNMLLNKYNAGEQFDLFIQFVKDETYDGNIVPAWIEEWDNSADDHGRIIAAHAFDDDWSVLQGFYRGVLTANTNCNLYLTDPMVTQLSHSMYYTDYAYPSARATMSYVDAEIRANAYPVIYETNSSQHPFNFATANTGTYIITPGNINIKKFYYQLEVNGSVYNWDGTCHYIVITKKYSDASVQQNFGYLYFNGTDGKLDRITSTKANGYISINHQYGFFNESFITNQAQILTGVKTFASLPQTSSYITPTLDTQLVSKKYVDDRLNNLDVLHREIVETLPTQNIDLNTIYMVLKSSPTTGDIYDEYMYINNAWEHIGSTEVDLSNYLAKNNTIAYTPSEQYNPSTKGYVDNYFLQDSEANWDLLTPQQQAAYAIAVITYGFYELTPEDIDNLDDTLGSDEPIVSDMTEDEGIELTNEIIGGNE